VPNSINGIPKAHQLPFALHRKLGWQGRARNDYLAATSNNNKLRRHRFPGNDTLEETGH
jgi:hypothetical protein